MPIYESSKLAPGVGLEEGQSFHKGKGAEGLALFGLSKKPSNAPSSRHPGPNSRSLSHHPSLNGSRESSQGAAWG